MKILMLSTLLLIVSTSMCAYLSGIELPELLSPDQVQQASINTVVAENPDVFLRIETTKSEIKAGRDMQIMFEITNKQAYDLKNVVLEAYDHPCFGEGEFIKNDCGTDGTIKANRSCVWTWKWTSKSLDIDTNCPIKFRTSYDAEYSFYQDIAVLSEDEYFQREAEGTLKDIPVQSSYTSSPLDISIRFSEEQPFLENQKNYYMYIDYYNNGNGLFGDTSITINAPNNIKNLNCYGFSGSLTFIKGKANPTTCSFDTGGTTTIDIRSLSITAKYKYVLYNSISLRVNR
jgi:hypothetical protein